MEDYARLTAAAQAGDRQGMESAQKALEQRVRDEAKLVRQYISAPETTPFAVLYLATEGLYAQILGSRSGLAEKLQHQRAAGIHSAVIGRHHIALFDDVHFTDLEGVHVKSGSQLVDGRFHRKQALGRTIAAVRTGRHVVGVDHVADKAEGFGLAVQRDGLVAGKYIYVRIFPRCSDEVCRVLPPHHSLSSRRYRYMSAL